jgi:hypothetical protein
MKEAWDWEEADIEALIRDGVQESLTLDYKRCASLDRRDPQRKTELSKDVSAFANSAGGVIVYGVIEDNHLPVQIDDGYDPTDVTREWLEQVINSTIQRRIDGIRIKQIELETTNPGRVIYAVYIPQSTRAPHMAEDHRFYKRYNFQSIAMEEYEVRDVANRNEAPDLEMSLYLPNDDTTLEFADNSPTSQPVALNAQVHNLSSTPAMYYVATILIDPRLTIAFKGKFTSSTLMLSLEGGKGMTLQALYLKCSVPLRMPIWRGQSYILDESGITITIPRSSSEVSYMLGWSMSSPGMKKKMGFSVLRVRNDHIELVPFEGLSEAQLDLLAGA